MRLLKAAIKALLCIGMAIAVILLTVAWVSFSTEWPIVVRMAPFIIMAFSVITAGFYDAERKP